MTQLFQRKLIKFLTEHFDTKPTKIIYVSDGCAGQYKNCYNFKNLCHHKENFDVEAEWHFFATAHGKSGADGIGGNCKKDCCKGQPSVTYRRSNSDTNPVVPLHILRDQRDTF